MQHTVYVENGSIYTMNGNILASPSIIFISNINEDYDTLLKYGNLEQLERMFPKCAQLSRIDPEDKVYLISFNDFCLNPEQICYIIRRATEFSGTIFLRCLLSSIKTSGFAAWLEAEMERVPIDVYSKEYACH